MHIARRSHIMQLCRKNFCSLPALARKNREGSGLRSIARWCVQAPLLILLPALHASLTFRGASQCRYCTQLGV